MNTQEYKTNIGIHVFKHDSLDDSITDIRESLPINAVQIFTHGPRSLKQNAIDVERVIRACEGINLYIHSPYPINPWRGTNKCIDDTVQQFIMSNTLEAKGVVLHIPKIQPEDVVGPVVTLVKELNKKRVLKNQKIILEMKAVKCHPTMSYESPDKINRLINLLKMAGVEYSDVGICIDTAHIYAGGAEIKKYESSAEYCNRIEYPEWICLIHLNGNEYDAKKRAGDKHAIPFDSADKIWDSVLYENSGCKAFIDFAQRLDINVILEIKKHHTVNQVRSFLNLIK